MSVERERSSLRAPHAAIKNAIRSICCANSKRSSSHSSAGSQLAICGNKQVLRQWFSYRTKNRERPQIGDKVKPSPLGDIQPDHWLPGYTSELINVLNVLGMRVELEPKPRIF